MLNRPDARNALNASLVGELRSALREAADDNEIRTVVISGAGSAFSAGADLSELQALRSASVTQNRASSEALASLFGEIRRHPKPIVARVNGHAIAGGCGLAIACDLAVAANGSKLGFTEVRIGFVPAIVSRLLRNRVSDGQIRSLLLTGRLIDAPEAAEIGLIHQAVPAEELDKAVSEITSAIALQTSPTAVALTKRMLAATDGMPADAAATFLTSFNALARQTGDVAKGIDSFLNKEKPSW
jgi:methylglutaconyl-CoA hydratase